MGKDYYSILGVSRDADEDTLKKAYRKLALKWVRLMDCVCVGGWCWLWEEGGNEQLISPYV